MEANSVETFQNAMENNHVQCKWNHIGRSPQRVAHRRPEPGCGCSFTKKSDAVRPESGEYALAHPSDRHIRSEYQRLSRTPRSLLMPDKQNTSSGILNKFQRRYF